MRRRLPWLVFGAVMLAMPLGGTLGDFGDDSDVVVALVLLAFVIAFAGVGALVASRLPAHPLGWIMLAAGGVYGLMVAADLYAQPYLRDAADGLPGSVAALWFGSWGWVLAVGPTATLLLLLFPTGRPPSPRWRPVAWTALGGLALAAVGLALTPGRLEGYDVINPVGLQGAEMLAGAGMLALAVAAIASVASLFVRFRRAAFAERQQLKWLLWAAGLVAIVIVAIAGVGATGIDVGDELINSGMTGALVAVPVAIGIAILRHGLFDIDVVINRTLVYAALSATLAAAYLAGVLLLQLTLSPLTEDNDLAIAGSTLAAAALFRPARARIQALVDRRFYRRKYDATRTIEGFGATLRDEIELDSLAGDLRAVVQETMQPAHLSLWLRTP